MMPPGHKGIETGEDHVGEGGQALHHVQTRRSLAPYRQPAKHTSSQEALVAWIMFDFAML